MTLRPTLLMLATIGATSAFAQMNQPMIGENTTKVSDHVWAIMGFPNIAIVVGSHATLVVDTGLGLEKWSNHRTCSGKARSQQCEALPHYHALPS